ncbi:MAG: DUF2141 domain-containing protein [Spirochaetales bacterium]|nr:DUF2141 domain-containing protein [Spirochaetales bacterium]
MLRKIIFICVGLFVSVFLLSADEYTIKGRVLVKETGILYIGVFDEQAWEKDDALVGITLPVDELDVQRGFIDFCIDNLVSGIYMLSSFLDQNNNEELDMGLIFPKEPYGFYNKGRIPSFKKMSFSLNRNIENIEIKLR